MLVVVWLCGTKWLQKRLFHLPDLVNEVAAMPTEKGEENVMLFTKEQFNAGLRFPLPALFKEFLHFSQIPPIFIHPNLVRFVRAPALPSDGDRAARLDKGRGEGAGGGSGCMGGAIAACVEALLSKLYLKNSGSGIEGPPCGLGGKGVLRLCLQIIRDRSKERAYKTLLSARNLTAVVRESQEYEAKEADAERRRKLLEDRDQKKLKALSGRLPDRSGVRTLLQRKLQEKGGSCNDRGASKRCSAFYLKRPGRMSGLNHSGPSLAAVARLANVAEEAASINRPGNLNPDADAAETAPLEEAGQKAKERQQEIEVSCASAHDAHPDGGEVEMATETSAAPVIIPDEDVEVPNPRQELASVSSSEEEPADDAAPASPFSYAELEVKLKQITPDWKAIKPSAKMFDMIETLVRGLRSMAQQHDLFTQLLQTADYMRTFSSRRQEIENQLRLRMEEAEANLSIMREENEALRVELAEAKSREESTASRLHEAEGEAARLRDEVSQLRTEVSNEKKQKEDLQLRLDVQKEELEREFAVEREELAADYQQQVDDMFIFEYRCCMKKNGIKRDTPSIPPGEEKKLYEKPLPNGANGWLVWEVSPSWSFR
ncbi:hypothetical protein CK203_070672 [Vitis vinifera]|uniref:Uncharacterized protein n=1 Tax=Vitis vinifera TaxID=29760 RepID=A0A438C174_VITVI|nr:hypothetical protein CK203_070672 [Vitis vinifera]